MNSLLRGIKTLLEGHLLNILSSFNNELRVFRQMGFAKVLIASAA
jgi:hypothetical protein